VFLIESDSFNFEEVPLLVNKMAAVSFFDSSNARDAYSI
jgi:hypothetical protein